MIEISISGEFADEHRRFMAECAERGHRVEVFETTARRGETEATGIAGDRLACVSANEAGATPGRGVEP